jgi:putative radical SAM enzyme (TIGR03279 family)
LSYKPIPVMEVAPGSIAEEAGIEKGDVVVSINGEKIGDVFDYRFLIADEYLTVEVRKSDGEIWEIEIEKDPYEDLGIEFESSMLDEARSCTNKCIFCFIDQLPEGMRSSLYFKDDDSRLSFLSGNYITLTNISSEDINRIIRYRMSPINVSVHTTNPDLRILMLKNRFAGDVMNKIRSLVDGGITVNCQIVLCRGVNDGEELNRSIGELCELYPGVSSISIVPVGITRYREGLCSLLPFDKNASVALVEQVSAWQTKLYDRFGSRIAYLADEFYIMGGLDIPSYEEYEDFPQIENGVGLIAQFQNEFHEYMGALSASPIAYHPLSAANRHVSIATGVSAAQHINKMAQLLEKRYNVKVSVYAIKNFFFGENVTVTGLLTGKDLIGQLEGKPLGEELLICRCMLKAGETVFLDNFTVDMLQHQLSTKVTIVENSGEDFINKVLGINY